MSDVMIEIWCFCGFVWIMAIAGLIWAVSKSEQAPYWADDAYWPLESLLDDEPQKDEEDEEEDQRFDFLS